MVINFRIGNYSFNIKISIIRKTIITITHLGGSTANPLVSNLVKENTSLEELRKFAYNKAVARGIPDKILLRSKISYIIAKNEECISRFIGTKLVNCFNIHVVKF